MEEWTESWIGTDAPEHFTDSFMRFISYAEDVELDVNGVVSGEVELYL